jgi:hypothetical protein
MATIEPASPSTWKDKDFSRRVLERADLYTAVEVRSVWK